MEINDDQKYIGMILKGDSSAYRFLVERNKKMVFSIALRLLNNTEEAEDAAQESFIKAYQQLHAFEGKSKFSTWLYTITYRICLSKSKTNPLGNNAIDSELTENYPDSMSSPYNELAEKENTMLVKEAIQKLPKIDALLITLYYFNENSVSEIEEITGLTASNIKIKLFRARNILEHTLKYLI
ncbi:MAG: sigma-70 family RNA polymerase sigma factor [Saprospiraceae bacterium]